MYHKFKNKYLTAVSATENGYRIDPKTYRILSKQLSKTTINFFDNSWIDTSAITLINFAATFETYHVEKSDVRSNTANTEMAGTMSMIYTQSRR